MTGKRALRNVVLAAAAVLSVAAGPALTADVETAAAASAASRSSQEAEQADGGIGVCADARVWHIDPDRVCVWVGW